MHLNRPISLTTSTFDCMSYSACSTKSATILKSSAYALAGMLNSDNIESTKTVKSAGPNELPYITPDVMSLTITPPPPLLPVNDHIKSSRTI